MIKIENVEVTGWEHAIRGCRNPLNSWDKSDTIYGTYWGDIDGHKCFDKNGFALGENDIKLMQKLCKAGTDHRKFMRMITVYVDITAPLYWWKEFDTYKIGTTTNSCSTMHTIHKKDFTIEDFSYEHLNPIGKNKLESTIHELNRWRRFYVYGGVINTEYFSKSYEPKDKECWWQIIQLLPTSYNQKRTVMLNYEVLVNIYKSRKNHKLDDWIELCKWIETLPYFKEIVLKENDNE